MTLTELVATVLAIGFPMLLIGILGLKQPVKRDLHPRDIPGSFMAGLLFGVLLTFLLQNLS